MLVPSNGLKSSGDQARVRSNYSCVSIPIIMNLNYSKFIKYQILYIMAMIVGTPKLGLFTRSLLPSCARPDDYVLLCVISHQRTLPKRKRSYGRHVANSLRTHVTLKRWKKKAMLYIELIALACQPSKQETTEWLSVNYICILWKNWIMKNEVINNLKNLPKNNASLEP